MAWRMEMEASLNNLKEELKKMIDEKCDVLDGLNLKILEDVEIDIGENHGDDAVSDEDDAYINSVDLYRHEYDDARQQIEEEDKDVDTMDDDGGEVNTVSEEDHVDDDGGEVNTVSEADHVDDDGGEVNTVSEADHVDDDGGEVNTVSEADHVDDDGGEVNTVSEADHVDDDGGEVNTVSKADHDMKLDDHGEDESDLEQDAAICITHDDDDDEIFVNLEQGSIENSDETKSQKALECDAGSEAENLTMENDEERLSDDAEEEVEDSIGAWKYSPISMIGETRKDEIMELNEIHQQDVLNNDDNADDKEEEDDDDDNDYDGADSQGDDDKDHLADLVSDLELQSQVRFNRNQTRPFRGQDYYRRISMPTHMFSQLPHDEYNDERTPNQISSIYRKSPVRRVHTVTPQASLKIKSKRPRAISRNVEAEYTKILQKAAESECFTITVDLPTCKEVVKVAAKRGQTLRDAIVEISETRNFPRAGVNVFIESSDSPTPLDCDCSLFAERQLFVKAKPLHAIDKTKLRSVSTSVVPQIHVNNEFSDIVAAESECFTITVDLPTCKEVVKVAAKRGQTLRDAIVEISETRNFPRAGVNVFIESSDSPTPLDCDCSLFAERQLFVKELEAKSDDEANFLKVDDGDNDDVTGPLNRSLPTALLRDLLLEGKDHFFRPRTKPLHAIDKTKLRSVSTSVVPQIHVNNEFSDIVPRSGGKRDLSKFLGVKTDKTGRTRRPSLPGTVSKVPEAKKMDPKLQLLQDKLDYYMLHGLPDFPSLIFAYPQREDDADILSLEENWRLVVDNHAEMPRTVIDQQEVIWEIVHTEVTYIKNIRVIIDVYLTCLIDLQAAGILNSIQAEKIFSNITDIEIKHSKFWKEKLINVMKVTRETRQPLSAAEVAKAFEGFGDHFQPYIKFVTEERSCMEFLREKQEEDEELKLFLQWCQDHNSSRRLKLGDLLVYPMQRITKYPLLLKAIHKKTEIEGDKAAVKRELENVQNFCNQVNHEVKREEETKKLKKMIERIEIYDWPEIPPVGAGSDEVKKLIEANPIMVNLHKPMDGACASQPRWVVYEGPVKIRDQYDKSRFDATIVIFTDMITICRKGKTKENNLRICRPPIRIDRVKTAEVKDGSGFVMLCSDDFNCAYMWYVVSTPKANTWLNNISKAKDMYENACNNKDMDKYLDTNQPANNYLQLPEWLEPNNSTHSPKTSPASSPKSQRHFAPKIKSPLTTECPFPEDNTKRYSNCTNEGDSSFDKESNGDMSTEKESQDADEEESEEGQTLTLRRPTDFVDNRGDENGVRLTKQDTLTPKDYGDFTFTKSECDPKAKGIMTFDDDDDDDVQSASPTSPNPNAVNIMQFDSDLEDDEDPLKPTPFSDVMSNSKSVVTPRRTQQLATFKGTWSKMVFKATKSRKPLPYNGVTRTKESQDIPACSSDGDEPVGDTPKKKTSKTNKLFGKKTPKS